jgi:hypothetical protein
MMLLSKKTKAEGVQHSTGDTTDKNIQGITANIPT